MYCPIRRQNRLKRNDSSHAWRIIALIALTLAVFSIEFSRTSRMEAMSQYIAVE